MSEICRYCALDHPEAAPRLPGGRYVSPDARQWISCREAMGDKIADLQGRLNLVMEAIRLHLSYCNCMKFCESYGCETLRELYQVAVGNSTELPDRGTEYGKVIVEPWSPGRPGRRSE